MNSGLLVYKRLLGYAKPYWPMLVLGIAGTALASGMDAAFTWSLKPVLDKGFIDKDLQFIQWLPLIIFGAFLVRGTATFLSNYCMAWVGKHVIMDFRQIMFAHLLQLPAQFYDGSMSGQLLSTLLYNVEQIAKASTDAVVTLVQESCFITGLIIVMFTINWQLALWFMVTVPLIAGVARYAG
ncbi:MAG: ABC transporter transmembrane domain-containing protein, partial [Gammaproteobacteria bacterium]